MLLLYPIFDSYETAIQKMEFKPNVFIIKITDHPDSLESLKHNKFIINIVGKGIMKSPGHPSGNQDWNNQIAYNNTIINYGQFPVLHRFLDGTVEYLGMYRHLETNIKLTRAGFRYFEYKLQLYNKSVDFL